MGSQFSGLRTVYGLGSFYVLTGVSAGVALLLYLIVAILLMNVSRFNNRIAAVVIATLCVIGQMFITLVFALLSGYGFLPAALAFLFAALLWIPTLMFGMTMTGSSWRTAFLITTAVKKGKEDADENGNGGRGAAEGSPTLATAIASLGRATMLVTMKHPIVFWLTSVFAFIFVLSLIIALAGVCFCTNPTELTTWASRRTDPKYCAVDEMCHVYSTLGYNASRLRVVSHIVTADAAPARAWLNVCPAGLDKACTAAAWRVDGRVIEHFPIAEDNRYLSHALLTGLNGSSIYRVESNMQLASGATKTKTIVVRTVPAPDANETVVMVGGGDYHSGEKGIRMLRTALRAEPNAQVLYIGGDLSYANNMRHCYLRWDRFLHAATSVVNGDGLHLPLLTIPGNHEAGGYLVEGDPSKYYFYTYYMPQYDDDVPRNPWTTYHSHQIGSQLGIVALDSGCITPVPDQVAYADRMMTTMRGIDPRDPAQAADAARLLRMRFTIVMYHNAVYRATARKPAKGNPAPIVKQHLVPLFDLHKIPLVLEFHEHVYKRTKPMNENLPRLDGDGVVYLGDGALGVFGGRDLGEYDYLQRREGTNYINVLYAFANKSVAVRAFAPSGETAVRVVDEISLSRRA